ncbi:MAG: DUF4157 domain-containing protein [Ilumatobacteraceae bacterium]
MTDQTAGPRSPGDRSDSIRVHRSAAPVAPWPPEDVARVQRSTSARPIVGSEGGEIGRSTAQRIAQACGGGNPLPDGVRGPMERAFGTELGAVRVHQGARASDLARSLSALAFESGADVLVGRVAGRLASARGERLRAHELAHVVHHPGPVVRRRLAEDVLANVEAPPLAAPPRPREVGRGSCRWSAAPRRCTR